MGDVPNVCFPCAALHDPATGRVAVYYGCADTVTGLAFGYIPEIIEFYYLSTVCAVLIRKQRMCPVAVTSARTHPLCLFPGKGTVWL